MLLQFYCEKFSMFDDSLLTYFLQVILYNPGNKYLRFTKGRCRSTCCLRIWGSLDQRVELAKKKKLQALDQQRKQFELEAKHGELLFCCYYD